eukprot:2453899-Rhodomonas_salina.1
MPAQNATLRGQLRLQKLSFRAGCTGKVAQAPGIGFEDGAPSQVSPACSSRTVFQVEVKCSAGPVCQWQAKARLRVENQGSGITLHAQARRVPGSC